MHFRVENTSLSLYNLDRKIPAGSSVEYSEAEMRPMVNILSRYCDALKVSAVHEGESAAVSPAELVAWAAEG